LALLILLVLASQLLESGGMHTPPTHSSSRQFMVSASRDAPAHRLISTMSIRWIADRIEVRFAAAELPARTPSRLQFGVDARRRLMGKR
jgi:hypothetical protein